MYSVAATLFWFGATALTALHRKQVRVPINLIQFKCWTTVSHVYFCELPDKKKVKGTQRTPGIRSEPLNLAVPV